MKPLHLIKIIACIVIASGCDMEKGGLPGNIESVKDLIISDDPELERAGVAVIQGVEDQFSSKGLFFDRTQAIFIRYGKTENEGEAYGGGLIVVSDSTWLDLETVIRHELIHKLAAQNGIDTSDHPKKIRGIDVVWLR